MEKQGFEIRLLRTSLTFPIAEDVGESACAPQTDSEKDFWTVDDTLPLFEVKQNPGR